MAKEWTEAEDELIRANFPGHGHKWGVWKYVLPGRTPCAIKARAISLHVHADDQICLPRDNWTDKQRKMLLVALDQARRTTGHTAVECINEATRMMLWRDEKGV